MHYRFARHTFLTCLGISLIAMSFAQNPYFPPVGSDEWQTLSLEEAGWCQDSVDALLEYLDDIESRAFIVLKDGKILIEEYFHGFNADSLWYWASAAKTLTAFAVGMAQEQGFLSIEDSSNMYLGDGWTALTPEQEGSITIRHQLTMTTGLDDGVSENHCTLDTCLVYLADPGTRWAYHNGPYTLLDEVIRNATEQTLNGYLQTVLKTTHWNGRVFSPTRLQQRVFQYAAEHGEIRTPCIEWRYMGWRNDHGGHNVFQCDDQHIPGSQPFVRLPLVAQRQGAV